MIPTAEGEVSVVFSRHRFAYEYAAAFAEGARVLDVGCGAGYGSGLLAARAAFVLGVDQDAGAVAYCRNRYEAPNVRFERADAAALPLAEPFDLTISYQVIEHVRDTGAFLDRLKQATRPGGRILVSTPNVRTFHAPGEGNPFHFSEMNYAQFERLIASRFTDYQILGVDHARPSRLRAWAQRLPFYRLGRLLGRRSPVKRAAARALRLTDYRIITERVAEDAIDLLAVCVRGD